MKKLLAIGIALLLSLQLIACGGSEGTDTSAGPQQDTTATEAPAAEVPEEVAHPEDWEVLELASAPYSKRLLIPQGPAPENVVIRDLKPGKGPVLQDGDDFLVRYVTFTYDEGGEVEPYWHSPTPYTFGSGSSNEGWEKGLEGIRVGGMREFIVPSRMADGTGARVYLVQVVKLS